MGPCLCSVTLIGSSNESCLFTVIYLQGKSTLWVDLYSPSTRDDLAVHKKKVQEVESWLAESAAGVKVS